MKNGDEIAEIISWAENKNLIHGSNVKNETLNLISSFGNLSAHVQNGTDVCKTIGDCVISLIIICRMKDVSLLSTMEFTKDLKDIRVQDPAFAIIAMMKYVGELAFKVNNHKEVDKDIKLNIGYILIYLRALTQIYKFSLKDCLEEAFCEVRANTDMLYGGKFIAHSDSRYEGIEKMVQSNIISRNKKPDPQE